MKVHVYKSKRTWLCLTFLPFIEFNMTKHNSPARQTNKSRHYSLKSPVIQTVKEQKHQPKMTSERQQLTTSEHLKLLWQHLENPDKQRYTLSESVRVSRLFSAFTDSCSASAISFFQFPHRVPRLGTGPQYHHIISHQRQLHYRWTHAGETAVSYQRGHTAGMQQAEQRYLIFLPCVLSSPPNPCWAPTRHRCCADEARGTMTGPSNRFYQLSVSYTHRKWQLTISC